MAGSSIAVTNTGGIVVNNTAVETSYIGTRTLSGLDDDQLELTYPDSYKDPGWPSYIWIEGERTIIAPPNGGVYRFSSVYDGPTYDYFRDPSYTDEQIRKEVTSSIRVSGDLTCIKDYKISMTYQKVTERRGGKEIEYYAPKGHLEITLKEKIYRQTQFTVVFHIVSQTVTVYPVPLELFTALDIKDDNGDFLADLVSGEEATVFGVLKFASGDTGVMSKGLPISVLTGKEAIELRDGRVTALPVTKPTRCELSASVRFVNGLNDDKYKSKVTTTTLTASKVFTVYPANYDLKTIRISKVYGFGAVSPTKARVLTDGIDVAQFNVRYGGSGKSSAYVVQPDGSLGTAATYSKEGAFTLKAGSTTVTDYEIFCTRTLSIGDTVDFVTGDTLDDLTDVYKDWALLYSVGKSTACPGVVSVNIPSSSFRRSNLAVPRFDFGSRRSEFPSINVTIDQGVRGTFSGLDLNGGVAPEKQTYSSCSHAVVKNATISGDMKNCLIKNCAISGGILDTCDVRCSVVTGGKLKNSSVCATEIKNAKDDILAGCVVNQCYIHDCRVRKMNAGGSFEGCAFDTNTGYYVFQWPFWSMTDNTSAQFSWISPPSNTLRMYDCAVVRDGVHSYVMENKVMRRLWYATGSFKNLFTAKDAGFREDLFAKLFNSRVGTAARSGVKDANRSLITPDPFMKYIKMRYENSSTQLQDKTFRLVDEGSVYVNSVTTAKYRMRDIKTSMTEYADAVAKDPGVIAMTAYATDKENEGYKDAGVESKMLMAQNKTKCIERQKEENKNSTSKQEYDDKYEKEIAAIIENRGLDAGVTGKEAAAYIFAGFDVVDSPTTDPNAERKYTVFKRGVGQCIRELGTCSCLGEKTDYYRHVQESDSTDCTFEFSRRKCPTDSKPTYSLVSCTSMVDF